MDFTKEIISLNAIVSEQSGQIAALTKMVSNIDGSLKRVPINSQPPVSNTPTATGYVPFFINGKTINLMTGS